MAKEDVQDDHEDQKLAHLTEAVAIVPHQQDLHGKGRRNNNRDVDDVVDGGHCHHLVDEGAVGVADGALVQDQAGIDGHHREVGVHHDESVKNPPSKTRTIIIINTINNSTIHAVGTVHKF